jgi:hypothetical protein
VCSPILGYFHVGHKETLRGVTGDRLSAFFPESMRALGRHLDESMPRLVQLLLQEELFGVGHTLSQLGEVGRLPLLRESSGERLRYGMLDVAHYFNVTESESAASESAMEENEHERKESESGGPAVEVRRAPKMNTNCMDHYDPGLLALSFLSTAPGLQLYDPVEKCWEEAPHHPATAQHADAAVAAQDYLAVLWSGHAAAKLSDGRIPPTRHRVQYAPEQSARMSMWYEVCTDTQDMDAATYASLSGRKVLIENVGDHGYVLDLTGGELTKLEANEESTTNTVQKKRKAKKKLKLTDVDQVEPEERAEGHVGDQLSKPKVYTSTPLFVEANLGLPMSKVEGGTFVIPVRKRQPSLLDTVKSTIRSWVGLPEQPDLDDSNSNSNTVAPPAAATATTTGSKSVADKPKYSLRDFEKRTGIPLTKKLVFAPPTPQLVDVEANQDTSVDAKQGANTDVGKNVLRYDLEAETGMPMSKAMPDLASEMPSVEDLLVEVIKGGGDEEHVE